MKIWIRQNASLIIKIIIYEDNQTELICNDKLFIVNNQQIKHRQSVYYHQS